MASPFSKSLAAIYLERSRKNTFWLIAACLLLVIWFVWFFTMPVAVYSMSQSARLEVHTNIQPIHAAVAGRIEKVNIGLGEEVESNELLLTLDSTRLSIELERAKQSLLAAEQEAASLKAHIQNILSGKESENSEVEAERITAQAHVQEAKITLEHAEDRLQRMQSLHKSGNVSEIELKNARKEFNKLGAAHQAAQSELNKMIKAGETRMAERAARVSELETDLARLQRDTVEMQANQKRLEYEISERQIRAPFAGRIGELADIYPGMQVSEGQRLGVFVPKGKLRVEAFFTPGDALGHIKPSQSGRLMFEGFPWTQYGSGKVTVSKIAEELREGLVEVQLELSLPKHSAIPLQHGMPASVEIEIEKALPVELVLRAAGKVVRSQ